MNQNRLTRRRFVTAVIALTAGAGSPIESGLFSLSNAWAESGAAMDPAVRDAMVRMARLLYPHDALPDPVYAAVLDQALADVATGAEFASALEKAAATLDSRAGGRWQDLDSEAQIRAMRSIESEAFFASIQNQVRLGIYMGEAFWKHVGYPGPAKGFGGYLRRGAGEVEWLGEES